MTIAVDLGRKATKQTKQVYRAIYAEKLSFWNIKKGNIQCAWHFGIIEWSQKHLAPLKCLDNVMHAIDAVRWHNVYADTKIDA